VALCDGDVGLFDASLRLEITLPNRERRIFTAPLPSEFNNQMQV